MKRVGFLKEELLSRENCELAIRNATRNKKDRFVVKRVLDDKESLLQELQTNPAISGVYKEKSIIDVSSGKPRQLAIPDIVDLVKQHQLMQVIMPIMERTYYEHSYGAIRGRGFIKASQYLRTLLGKKVYYVKLDIIKYYENIDHEILKDQFNNLIKDKYILNLINTIIDSHGKGKGLPIGNYTSQSFANFFLTPLDHYIKEEIGVTYYVRYMDDMLLMETNKRDLIKKLKLVLEETTKLKLKVHKERIRIGVVDEKHFIDMCAFKHYKHKVTIRKRIFNRIRKTVFKLRKFLCLKQAKRFMSYWGYLMKSDSHKFKAKYMPMINMANMRKLISTSMKGATI